MEPGSIALVTTIGERCRTCYTCVRECPAKAIRIADGQAQVIHERCIGCGNCVEVCSQDAKLVYDSVDAVEQLLARPDPVAAAVAPSFPADFPELGEDRFAGMLRAMGFDVVHEVGFGADLVAAATRAHLAAHPGGHWISTSCPAIVSYVEYYHPELTASLLPLVSPMVASAKVLHRLFGRNLKVVFIGPCIAKKGEAARQDGDGEVAAALTFRELRKLAARLDVDGRTAPPAAFDAPRAGLGAVFPLSRGLVQAAGMSEDLATGHVVSADGRQYFPEAIREFEAGDLDAELLDILCCNGCIMGAGMTTAEPMFRRRARISRYVKSRQREFDPGHWQIWVNRCADLDLFRDFAPDDRRMREPSEPEIDQILARMGKLDHTDELNCRACGYETCRAHAVAIFKGMAESEMCLPYVIDRLRSTVDQLHESHQELASTQEQLMHSERLASMGQLAAGIAHEVNNPLGVVILYAHLLQRECGDNARLREELSLIADQADRCKSIVAGLLDFARQNKVELQPVAMGELIDGALRGCVMPANVALEVRHEDPGLQAPADAGQLGQVLINLVNNAVAALGDSPGARITITSAPQGSDRVAIAVADNGPGIAPDVLPRVFEPFFTTRRNGQGTGLGLAVSYGIVKMHRGDIAAVSNHDPGRGPTGTTFTITLPARNGNPPLPGGGPDGRNHDDPA
ncbi:MAG: [Fe-Fe] hydrogenase large subunit C-terminal domain-containing protein [bacterium]